MTSGFVHLHVHTQYSFLDGAIRVDELMPRVKELGMHAVAMTDHGSMFGAIDFQKHAQKHGIKPIIGMNAYITPDRYNHDSPDTFHLTLLAKNLQGYRNLVTLASMGWIDGLVRSRTQTLPRIDFDLLQKHHEGLICLSGDLGSEASRLILKNKVDDAQALIKKYATLFGNDHYYIELIRGPLPEYTIVFDNLLKIANTLHIPTVATNDSHYLRKDNARAHAVLMAIQLDRTINLDSALDHGLNQLYIKSEHEMRALFDDLPEACDATVKIANMCDLVIPTGEVYLPRFQVPDSFRNNFNPNNTTRLTKPDKSQEEELLAQYFAEVTRQGLDKRIKAANELQQPIDKHTYEKRLETEISVIASMEFAGYFLIVWDFIAWSKQAGIPVGPGRGSGAGSLVAYSLEITDIDPLPYNLLFERFLNPERVSMPDFDIDFCTRRRSEVIEYVTSKYGEFNVAQIATFNQLKARAVIRDVGRALDIPLSRIDKLSKQIPNVIGISLEEALEQVPELTKARNDDPIINDLFTISLDLENLYRQAGLHAAGIVISDEPLWHYVPVFRGVKDEIVSQYAKEEVESAGLIKFDFLGLKTLTVIDDAVRLVNEARSKHKQPTFDLRSIPMNDPKVFDLISSGNTVGIFQLESDGFRRLITRLKPDCFEDIIAAVALYRPGPLGSGMVDDFIARKHRRKKVEYPHPSLEEVLEPTYGVFLYQEQVMKAAQIIAGYSLGRADILRRAMGKKKPEVMAQQKIPFVEGASANNIPSSTAEEIFDLLAYFSGYGFNKSHSAAYGLLTYQTAWLKLYHKVEFMAALMTNDRDNTDKVVRTIQDARAIGINVLPPDINVSGLDFTVAGPDIRFGLAAIKGVGSATIETVLQERKKQHFDSIYDFCTRVAADSVNKKTLEALIDSGAFDSISPDGINPSQIRSIALARSMMHGAITTAMERGASKQHDDNVGQYSLFDTIASPIKKGFEQPYYPSESTLSDSEVLEKEKAAMGFYVVGHPLDSFKGIFSLLSLTSTEAIANGRNSDGSFVNLIGIVEELRERYNDNTKSLIINFRLEDLSGSIACIVFSSKNVDISDIVKSKKPIFIKGRLRERRGETVSTYEVIVEEAALLEDIRRSKVTTIKLNLSLDDLTTKNLKTLKTTLLKHKTNTDGCNLTLQINSSTDEYNATICIPIPLPHNQLDLTDLLLTDIEQIFQRSVISYS